MPDIEERRITEQPGEKGESRYEEETPGHTPGAAEGDDEEAPHRAHPYEDPDKTPGSAEGED